MLLSAAFCGQMLGFEVVAQQVSISRDIACCGGTEQQGIRLTASMPLKAAALPLSNTQQLPLHPYYVPDDAASRHLQQSIQQQQHTGLAAAVHPPVMEEEQLQPFRLALRQQPPQQQHGSSIMSEASPVLLPPPASIASAMEGVEGPPPPPAFAQVISWEDKVAAHFECHTC